MIYDKLSYKKDSLFMDMILTIVLYILIFSGVIRHVIRTIGYISEYREKALNRRLERFKH